MRTWWMVRVVAMVVGVGAASSGCKKPPSPAQRGFEAFVGAINKNDLDGASALLAAGARLRHGELTGGVPEDGEVVVTPPYASGVLDWDKVVLVKEEPLENGDRRLEVKVDVCLRDATQDRCMRPNTFTYVVDMRDEDGWKVAASTCLQTTFVR